MPVTHEVAGSSPVVPASIFNSLPQVRAFPKVQFGTRCEPPERPLVAFQLKRPECRCSGLSAHSHAAVIPSELPVLCRANEVVSNTCGGRYASRSSLFPPEL